jgi:hypothetical protein
MEFVCYTYLRSIAFDKLKILEEEVVAACFKFLPVVGLKENEEKLEKSSQYSRYSSEESNRVSSA